MTSIRFFSISKLLAFSLLIGLLAFSSCSDDEASTPSGCVGFTPLEGNISIDNEELSLVVRQSIVTAGYGGTAYLFQIGGINSDCDLLRTVSLNLTVPDGETIDGTYDFDSYSSTSGSIAIQNIVNVSQSLATFESGSVTVSENGEDNFTFDISATTADGDQISVDASTQF